MIQKNLNTRLTTDERGYKMNNKEEHEYGKSYDWIIAEMHRFDSNEEY